MSSNFKDDQMSNDQFLEDIKLSLWSTTGSDWSAMIKKECSIAMESPLEKDLTKSPNKKLATLGLSLAAVIASWATALLIPEIQTAQNKEQPTPNLNYSEKIILRDF
jgi:hypothetical protein